MSPFFEAGKRKAGIVVSYLNFGLVLVAIRAAINFSSFD
jgi:hypothetical protein